MQPADPVKAFALTQLGLGWTEQAVYLLPTSATELGRDRGIGAVRETLERGEISVTFEQNSAELMTLRLAIVSFPNKNAETRYGPAIALSKSLELPVEFFRANQESNFDE